MFRFQMGRWADGQMADGRDVSLGVAGRHQMLRSAQHDEVLSFRQFGDTEPVHDIWP
jgi:hypothetical protein